MESFCYPGKLCHIVGMTALDTLRIRCDTKLKKSLAALARREQRTMSNLALHVLTEYVRANSAEPEVPVLLQPEGHITPEQLQAEMKTAGASMRETKPKGIATYPVPQHEPDSLNEKPPVRLPDSPRSK